MKTDKLKRILALAGVVLLVGMYISTLVLAVMNNKSFVNLFVLSVVCTIAVPIIIHLFLMLNNARKGKSVMDETYSYRDSSDEKNSDK